MRWARFVLQLTASVVCLGVAFALVRSSSPTQVLAAARPWPVVAVLALMPMAFFLRAWRWWYIVKRRDEEMPLRTMFNLTMIGMALNLVLPASLGDVARSYYGWRQGGNKEVMLASSVVDKIVALFSLCLLGAACAAALSLWKLSLAAVVFALPLGALLFWPNVVPWAWAVASSKKFLRRDLHLERLRYAATLDRQTLWVCLVNSLLGWVATNYMYYYACLALSDKASVGRIFAIAPLINLVRVMPITISGLGSADLLMVMLLKPSGITQPQALMASMIINVALIGLPGLWGALLMVMANRQIKSLSAAPAVAMQHPLGD